MPQSQRRVAVMEPDTYSRDAEIPPAVRLRGAFALSQVMDPAIHTAKQGRIAMAEPATTAAAGAALWKTFGVVTVFAAVGAFLAAVVTMCMMTPRSAREWAVGLISTVVCSLAGGAYTILKLGLLEALPDEPMPLYLSLVAGLGIVFACGLPGWAIVRATFTWLEKHKHMDLGELAAAARDDADRVTRQETRA